MNITIVGVGLIGGSMALKLREQGFASHLMGVDFDKNHLQQALELQIIDESLTLEQAVPKSDIIILAIPVDAIAKVLPKVLDLVTHQAVMDVGSTKLNIIKAIEYHPKRKQFVASHPMWGTENSGPAAAQKIAFANKAAVICNANDSMADAVQKIENLYKALEMNVVHMEASLHDVHVAYISHVSHITAYALANTVLEKEKEENTIFNLASGGFESTVRLAKSHPEMWVPIFKQNRENVLDVLNEHIAQLQKFKLCLEKENFEQLNELVLNANRIRGVLERKNNK